DARAAGGARPGVFAVRRADDGTRRAPPTLLPAAVPRGGGARAAPHLGRRHASQSDPPVNGTPPAAPRLSPAAPRPRRLDIRSGGRRSGRGLSSQRGARPDPRAPAFLAPDAAVDRGVRVVPAADAAGTGRRFHRVHVLQRSVVRDALLAP